MVVLDGNCAVGCGPGTDYRSIHIFQCMPERTDAITNAVLEPITFALAYPTVFPILRHDSVKLCRRRVENPNALTSALRQK
jgi:hypothetical protein